MLAPPVLLKNGSGTGGETAVQVAFIWFIYFSRFPFVSFKALAEAVGRASPISKSGSCFDTDKEQCEAGDTAVKFFRGKQKRRESSQEG